MRLEELVRCCTVKLSGAGMGSGTGFFIAPGYILTCEHVVRGVEEPIHVRWRQEEAFAEAKVLKTFPDCDVALLSFDPPREDLPCVYFDEELPDIEDRLYLFGYGNTAEHGDPVVVQVEGMTGDVPPFIKYRLGSIKPGMSGAALVNCRTGKVCGMSKFTVDEYHPQGGGGVPISTLINCLSFDVIKAQQQFHERDRRWLKAPPLTQTVQKQLPLTATGIPENLPRSGVVEFVGREQKLEILHKQLQESEQVGVSAIVGMGGVGKTELALQYALKYKLSYRGGVCWLQARGVDVGTQIVRFARSRLQLNPSEELDLSAQVGFCWTHWRLGEVLIIIDDVLDYKLIQDYLPPLDSRFKVLITSRLRLGKSIKQLEIDVLEESSAISLLTCLAGSDRLQQELDKAKQLCKWLGYLPLALELVGRYLDRSPDLSIAEMQQRLEKKRLEERALRKPDDDMTLSLGVAAAFDLSWDTLDDETQELSYLLSLFALAPIPWILVKQVAVNRDPDNLEEIRDENLLNLHLLQRKGKGIYQLHQLIREFLQDKDTTLAQSENLKQLFCQGMVTIARQVPESPTRKLLLELELAMPHVAEVATNLRDYLNAEELLAPFRGLSRFYEGQGFYARQEFWYRQCLETIETRFGNEHLSMAASLSGLALAYRLQGKYSEAKPLSEQALVMRRKFLGEEHPDVADSLNNLGLLLKAQGKYSEAEPLYIQALEMRQKLLGEEHPDIADSFNNLALLYNAQGRYQEAELLFVQALEMRRKLLGEEHPRVATSFNSLASCYSFQKRYGEAEMLYLKALKLYRQLQGEENHDVATVLNNIGQIYAEQGKFGEAELMFLEAFKIQQCILGEEHPDIAFVLNNIASTYSDNGNVTKAEEFYIKALEMRRRLLGKSHPYTAISVNNLAKLYHIQKRYAEAEPLYVNAIEQLNSRLNAEHPILIKVRNNLEEMRVDMNTDSSSS